MYLGMYNEATRSLPLVTQEAVDELVDEPVSLQSIYFFN